MRIGSKSSVENTMAWNLILVYVSIQLTVFDSYVSAKMPEWEGFVGGHNQSRSESDVCPDMSLYSFCTCYDSQTGLYIECRISFVNEIEVFLKLLVNKRIKSLSIYNTNQTIDTLPDGLFRNFTSIKELSISSTSVTNLTINTFTGLETSLISLSLLNNKFDSIPVESIRELRNIAILDMESNYIKSIDSYSVYGLPLISLNLQSNQIQELSEFSLGGLENTLEELILINNKLKRFPLQALRRLRKLEILKLQNNQICDITDDGFTRFTVLKVLDLHSNRINHLDRRSFITVPKLVTLSLANNRLTVLSDNSIFIDLIDLETLDLSLNRLRVVDLNGLINLRTVDLSYNHLHDIQFHNMKNLKEVFVSNNNILRLTNETFINTTTVQVLYLQHNAIHIISDNAFQDLKHLLIIDLSYNRLKSINPTHFKHNKKLQSLYLDNNLIVDSGLEPGVFQELVELRDLRLQKNLLKRIRKGVLYSLPNLQELDLQMNRIEVIESLESCIALQHINVQNNRLITFGDVLSKYPSGLRSLQLNHNQISTLHNQTFRGQTQLELLFVNNNKLNRLTKNLFQDLTQLQKIYLNNNEITVIEDLTFEMMKNLIYINLENNNLQHLSSKTFKGIESLIELRLCSSNIIDIESNAFESLKSLKMLDLSHNRINVINDDMFASDLDIEELKLSDIMCDRIESKAFEKLKALQYLDISANNFSKSQTNFLENLPQVKHLDISINNLTENILNINPFKSVEHLETLDLSETYFNTNKSNKLFDNIRQNIKVLKLKSNAIRVLTRQTFDSKVFPKLRELYLNDNELTTIPETDVLQLMPELEILSLSGNRIKHIQKSAFISASKLRILNISSNSVSVLDKNAFTSLTLLRELDLSYNVIRGISSGLFDNCSDLEFINFDNNWLQSIPNNLIMTVMQNMKTLTLNSNPILRIREDLSISGGFPSLQKLSINSGNISIIASNDLIGFPNLKTLSLRSNRIQKISPSAFSSLSYLSELDLSANLIDIIPEERLRGLYGLKILNLSENNLIELTQFSSDLLSLDQIDLSFNRLTRILSFGHLSESVRFISLNHNMIGWIANNAFQNMTQLERIDLRNNFLTHLSDALFESIEVRIQSIRLSGNPFHCDCRLLSLYDWLEVHSRLISSTDREDMICSQPEKLKDFSILNLHAVDFCPVPIISLMEINKLESRQLTLKWDVQNDSLVGGFTLEYHSTSDTRPDIKQQFLGPFERHSDIKELSPDNWYTVCIEANGKYVRSETNKPTPYVIDQKKYFADFVTTNRKCSQIRTLSDSQKTLISLPTLGIIVGIVFFVIIIITTCVVLSAYKLRKRRRRPKNDVPEEYITYRHFSLPSNENVY